MSETLAALGAFKGLFAQVDRLVLLEGPFPPEPFLADGADKRLLSGVNSFMRQDCLPGVARVRAVGAAELPERPVHMTVSHVPVQVLLCREAAAAHVAGQDSRHGSSPCIQREGEARPGDAVARPTKGCSVSRKVVTYGASNFTLTYYRRAWL